MWFERPDISWDLFNTYNGANKCGLRDLICLRLCLTLIMMPMNINFTKVCGLRDLTCLGLCLTLTMVPTNVNFHPSMWFERPDMPWALFNIYHDANEC